MTPDLSAFGDVRLIRPLPGGHRNTVWLIETPRGHAVAKSTRHGPDALAWLAPVQAAARAAGFFVPAFQLTGGGAVLSNGWTIEDWIAGPALKAAEMRGVTERLADFHNHIPHLAQRPGMQSLAAMALSGLTHLSPDIAHLCQLALMPYADQPIRPIHGDITPSNLINGPEGPALIDWDESRCDLPFLDFVAVTSPDPTKTCAHLAAEIIHGWAIEPDYAKACANRLALL